MNWVGLTFIACLFVGFPCTMTAMLIHDHIEKKRRDRRCHGRIRNWWELEVK